MTSDQWNYSICSYIMLLILVHLISLDSLSGLHTHFISLMVLLKHFGNNNNLKLKENKSVYKAQMLLCKSL